MVTAYSQLNKTPVTTTTTVKSWVICLVAGLFFFYEFFQLTMFNTLEPYLMQNLSIAADKVSQISAYYFYAEMICLFPAGLLLDRFSVKWLIIISLSICVVGTYGFSLATTVLQCNLLRFMEGIGAALCFLSSLKLASRWFHPRHLALINGVLVTMAMIGGMLAQKPLRKVIEMVGWRQAITYDAIAGILCIALIAMIVKDYPPQHKNRFIQEIDQLSSIGFFNSILLAGKNLQTWLAGLYTCLMNLPIFLLGALNGTLFLTQIHHLSSDQASTVSGVIFLGTVVGSPTFGYISDLIGKRKLPMVIGAILSLITIMPILAFGRLSFIDDMFLFFMIGFVTSSQVLTYPLVTEANPKLLTGTSLSIASVIIMSGGAIFQPLFGSLMSIGWHHHFKNGIALYSQTNYFHAFLIMPAGFIASLILCYFIKETYCLSFEKTR